jgi:hypothetical protein
MVLHQTDWQENFGLVFATAAVFRFYFLLVTLLVPTLALTRFAAKRRYQV